MLILVEHDQKSFSLQINITEGITSIVQWINDTSIAIISELRNSGVTKSSYETELRKMTS